MGVTMERRHHSVTFALLAVAAVAYALLQSLVAPALLTIQHDLGTSAAGAAWILTAYLLSASVCTPVAGRLGDMFGKKRTLVIVLAVLAAGTALAAVSTSIERARTNDGTFRKRTLPTRAPSTLATHRSRPDGTSTRTSVFGPAAASLPLSTAHVTSAIVPWPQAVE